MIIKSKIYNVMPSIDGVSRYHEIDRIIVNKDFLWHFGFDKYYEAVKCEHIIESLHHYLFMSQRNIRYKYQEKAYNTALRVYKGLKAWGPDALIYFEEGIKL